MDREWKDMIKIGVIVIAFVLTMFVLVSCQESRVFNKLTGAETTTLDAMFVQLRVVEPVLLEREDE